VEGVLLKLELLTVVNGEWTKIKPEEIVLGMEFQFYGSDTVYVVKENPYYDDKNRLLFDFKRLENIKE